MDFLARNDGPISKEQWDNLDNLVVDTIRTYLVGRKFISLYGPLGAGMPAVMSSKLEVSSQAPVSVTETALLDLKEISQDFIINWKSLEMSSRLGIPVDFSVAAAAAYQFAIKEDTEIFEKLLSAKGKLTFKPGDWAVAGGVLGDATKAIGKLVSSGHIGPYSIIMSPLCHSSLYRFVGTGGVMEIKILEDLMKSGVFVSNHLTNNQMLIIESGSMNIDLALGLDAKTAYLGPTEMNHVFRIIETAAPRIKRPGAICLIEK